MACSLQLEMVRAPTLLLARDVTLPGANIREEFEAICATHSDYEVLYTLASEGSDDRNNRILILCNEQELPRVQESQDDACASVYALRKKDFGSAFQQRRSAPCLVPKCGVMRRDYSLLSREEAQARASTGGKTSLEPNCALSCNLPAAVTPSSNKSDASVAQAEATAPQPLKVPDDSLPVQKNTRNEVVEAEGKPPAQESAEFSTVSGSRCIPEGRSGKGEKRQQTLFGGMQVSSKRGRSPGANTGRGDSLTKKSRTLEHKPDKGKKATTSLLKLSKASNKRNGGMTSVGAAAAASEGVLDADDMSANSSCDDEVVTAGEDGFLEEVEPALDVITTPAANDEIIICDNALPMVFCAPDPLPPVPRRETMRPRTDKEASDCSPTQPKMTDFLQPEVLAFQKAYTRDVETDTVVENNVHICTDRVVYRHNKTGETISESEFYQRSSIISSLHNNKGRAASAKEQNASLMLPRVPKPAANRSTGVSKKEKVGRQICAPLNTLTSYFKPVSG
ncbi:hypothetical protein TRVL_00070 [Trypanosoma vivax]|uniref:Uncharacterized protein n=1 Tax=Trypanosoma vivax (strain Y486) TaxID=1055687 RepID=G0TTS9_TRYVY|nr:hypothetical protein TRVL_00070 [Trypanosoma vivax]CCC47360.1 conserved hypothetical protein [Trypanosoma vivax Y486]